ncbi:ROK family protein [Bifidobacterium sp. SMB2]|uniref:ROK family protein n=1 Tax=Bifidobacterium saimiriisciurei TaxID=2661627 RepID=A0ABX0CAT8_9BIFI|nr:MULTISPECIES: ROK family protein [Bifidobacterium]NEG96223.1 ROK family protein [Bifidobacterium sp. SMB2]NEH12236.1 ROK family protein [Bifidobacterium saimiriisciurei]
MNMRSTATATLDESTPGRTASGKTTTKLAKRRMILDYMYTHKKGSRQDIAAAVPCSLPIIAQNLAVLEDEGLIRRTGFLTSTGGRKPQNYAFVPRARMGVGVSIFADGMDVCAVDLDGRRLDSSHIDLTYENTDTFYDNACTAILRFVTDVVDREGIDPRGILGIAFSVQGRVSPDGDQITFGGILGNTGLSVRPFAERLDFPCQFIHDSYSAATAEVWFDPSIEDAFCLYLNEHVGSAVIMDGRVRQGADLRTGNCEHMTLMPGGRTCYCGRRGCMDAYCSRAALLGEEGGAGRAPSVEEFFRRLRAGDESCVKAFDDYMGALAQAIANMRSVLSVDVILGGDIARFLTDAELAGLTRRVQGLDPFPTSTVRLRRSVAQTDGVAGQSTLGAALHYVRRFVDESTGRA